MKAYAEGTEVPVERTREEIEKVVSGAGATSFAYFRGEEGSAVVFRLDGVMVKLVVPPVKEAPKNNGKKGKAFRTMSPEQAERWCRAEDRRRWRVLLIAVKAKLELVRMGQSTVLREFLADAMLTDGRTVAEEVGPQLEEMYASGKAPKLLLLGSGS